MAEEVMEVTEEATPEEETLVDTQEPTTEKSLSDALGDMFDASTEDSTDEAKEVSVEAEAAEEAAPKVVLTRKEKEALKHADMEEAVKDMEPSAVKAFAKKLAAERSAKDKAMSEKGKLQEQLDAKELAESEQFDIDSDENEWMPDEAKEAFKAKDAQLKAFQERLEALEQGSDHTVERFWDKIDKTQYSQYVEGDDAGELRGEIEGDANAYMASRPGITRAEALAKCLEIANHDQIVKSEVAKEVAKRLRKKRGGITPVQTGGQRLPATGTGTIADELGAAWERRHA